MSRDGYRVDGKFYEVAFSPLVDMGWDGLDRAFQDLWTSLLARLLLHGFFFFLLLVFSRVLTDPLERVFVLLSFLLF